MRRLLVGMAMIATVSMPLTGWAGDREIAQQIISKLKTFRDSGQLKDFQVDLKVNDGVVAFTGNVATVAQRKLVLDATRSIGEIKSVVDDMKLVASQPSSTSGTAALEPQLVRSEAAVTTVKTQTEQAPLRSPGASMIASNTQGVVRPANQVVVPEAIPPVASEPVMKLATAIEPVQRKPAPQPSAPQTHAVSNPTTPRPVIVPDMSVPPAGNADQELGAAVTQALTQAKSTGQLRGFAMDITTNSGDVWLRGRTVDEQQHRILLDVVRNVPGVKNVIDDINVMNQRDDSQSGAIRQTSDSAPVAQTSGAVQQAVPQPRPLMQRSQPRMMPVPYRASTMPQPFAPASMGGNMTPATHAMGGQPMPMQPASMGMAHGAPRHDQPNMPNYAWPGYSAYPNYAALSYPKQYSPTAWPYIGPFYPYPQVPLNWRKVTLEWDDGWWFLDYSSKSR